MSHRRKKRCDDPLPTLDKINEGDSLSFANTLADKSNDDLDASGWTITLHIEGGPVESTDPATVVDNGDGTWGYANTLAAGFLVEGTYQMYYSFLKPDGSRESTERFLVEVVG